MDIRDEIKHIVVLMLENRSFDNVLGWLYAPDNRPQRNIPRENLPNFDGLVTPSSHFWNSLTPESPDGKPFVWATKGVTKSPNEQPNPCPQEDYPSFLEQMFGFDPFETGHAGQPMRANMGGFLKNYARIDGNKAPERIMESFAPHQVPVISQLAKEFAVCDRWFCSVPSETWPNRSFVHAGTSFGRLNNGDQLREHRDPVPNLTFYSGKRTVFDVLSEQSKSWKVYQFAMLDNAGMPARGTFAAAAFQRQEEFIPTLTSGQFWSVGQKLRLAPHKGYFKEFEQHAREGNLPNYSFIEPSFIPPTNDQHPGPLCDMRAGEELIYRTYVALSQGPRWANTMLIILYDEHGGCYDHVEPPDTAVPPDDSEPQFPLKGFSPFRQFGPRVPAVVVSPFIEAGTVFRAPKGQTEYDHTSVLATIRDWVFRGGRPSADRWLPSKRVEAAPTLWPVLTLTSPRTSIKPPPRRVMATGSRGPEASLSSDSPALLPDIGSMTSIQLGLAIEAEAMKNAIDQSRTSSVEDIDPETWQKLIDEATARYLKGSGADSPSGA
jgi:phospholipase C